MSVELGGAAVDEGLVGLIRTRVGDRLAAEQALLRAAGRRLEGSDEVQLAASLAWSALRDDAAQRLDRGRAPLAPDQEAQVHAAVLDRMFGASRLAPLLERADVTDIHAVAGRPAILTLTDGTTERAAPVADTGDELVDMVRQLARRSGHSERLFDPAHPRVNLRLPDGSRLFALGWVVPEPHVFIRRHHLVDVSLDDLLAQGDLTPTLRRFLGAAVRARLNIVVSGAMGAGKTTLLRALAADIDPDERITTIESDFELGLDQLPLRHRDVVACEGREPNVEGVGEVSLADLVRWAKRTNAMRVIVGEVVADEVVPMLDAMNSGAAGSMCTVHANSAGEVFSKIALLASRAEPPLDFGHTLRFCGMAIDLAVHVHRTSDGRRVVAGVDEVVGGDDRGVSTNAIFRPGTDGRAWPTGTVPREATADRLAVAGFDRRWLMEAGG